jgi:CVNH domain
MKTSIFAVICCGIGFFLASNPVMAAATWPSGNFFESCNGCAVRDYTTVITCNCRRANGTTGKTSINFATCIGRSLINNNGTLQCAR